MDSYAAIAFTPSVVSVQHAKGVRGRGATQADEAFVSLSPDEIDQITMRDSFYLASVSESGWPYVQHRGGDVGFVKILGERTVGWIERTGNRQYVSAGNIRADGRVAMIFVDYPNRSRLKVYGHATHVAEPSAGFLEALRPDGFRVDGAVTVDVVATDWNCQKYITPRFTIAEIRRVAPDDWFGPETSTTGPHGR